MAGKILRCCVCGKSRKVGPASYGTPKGMDVLIQSSRFSSVFYHGMCGFDIRNKLRKEFGDIIDFVTPLNELIPPTADELRKG